MDTDRFAVMVLVEGDVWRYAAGGVLITGDPDEATWLPTLTEAEAYKARRASTSKSQIIVCQKDNMIEEIK